MDGSFFRYDYPSNIQLFQIFSEDRSRFHEKLFFLIIHIRLYYISYAVSVENAGKTISINTSSLAIFFISMAYASLLSCLFFHEITGSCDEGISKSYSHISGTDIRHSFFSYILIILLVLSFKTYTVLLFYYMLAMLISFPAFLRFKHLISW